jgi:hypothetical protein
MRCLFTMFAEDVELLTKDGFKTLLEKVKDTPQHFVPLLHGLWDTMNKGGFSPQLMTNVLKFNGGLFTDIRVLPLDREQIKLLIAAATSDWKFVEPSIFGTLLERALDPGDRHKLGAHYTPRAYVERLVMPTIIEPLREEWRDVQAAALTLEKSKKHKAAVEEIRAFHRRLCDVKVLDPACGTGNFLYVTLEHMKRLEGEILNTLQDLGETAMLEMGGNTVDPHQFLGIEINPRAAAIAEMVLWIGYLQWHFRTHGHVNPPEPVLRNFHNIENRDALLAYDKFEFVVDEKGIPVTRWDGKTYKKHPVTGEDVPDESAQRPLERYVNPRKAEWPKADFVVGNPPFIGASTMRRALGDGYVDALRATWKEVPESADFVMHWWHIAAELTRAGKVRRFGFITTNSLRQTFNRRVIQKHLDARNPLFLTFAIPDHPWVDSKDGASVRIAMTVASCTEQAGRHLVSIKEVPAETGELAVEFRLTLGQISSGLELDRDVANSIPLKSNAGLSFRGVSLIGAGFVVEVSALEKLGNNKYVKPFLNGRDIAQRERGLFVIDLYGLAETEVREKEPSLYQWLLDRVKPDRDARAHTPDGKVYAANWWLLGKPRGEMRKALHGLHYSFVTPMTAKHRVFVSLSPGTLADQGLIVIALDDYLTSGVLSSRLHVMWALANGGRLGVGNDPRYNNSRCFETFPFPDATDAQKGRIRELAESLDAHRKRQQAAHPDLTMTGMYNVLEKLRAGEPLNAKEKVVHEQGLVSVLKEIHDDLDRTVFAAYGWSDLADKLVGRPGATTPLPDKPADQAEAEEELLRRLVALNVERAAEEARGIIRWLRPEFQAPQGTATQTDLPGADVADDEEKPAAAPAAKEAWPKALQEQVKVIRQHLSTVPMSADALAERFKRKPVGNVQAVLDALEELGVVEADESRVYRVSA